MVHACSLACTYGSTQRRHFMPRDPQTCMLCWRPHTCACTHTYSSPQRARQQAIRPPSGAAACCCCCCCLLDSQMSALLQWAAAPGFCVRASELAPRAIQRVLLQRAKTVPRGQLLLRLDSRARFALKHDDELKCMMHTAMGTSCESGSRVQRTTARHRPGRAVRGPAWCIRYQSTSKKVVGACRAASVRMSCKRRSVLVVGKRRACWLSLHFWRA